MENKAVYVIVILVVGAVWLLSQAAFVNRVSTDTRGTENSTATISVCQRLETYRCDTSLIEREAAFLSDCGKVFPSDDQPVACIDGCRASGYCKEFIKP